MTWWDRLLRGKQLDEDLDKELRFHIDQYTDDLVANGHSREQARREARLALGGPEQLKEDCRDARGTRWLEDLWQDFRYALRALRQRPAFVTAAILTLALGTGATTVMPPYSPDLNPIEKCWAQMKQKLRAPKARSVITFLPALREALATLTPQNAVNYFRHCGYPL